MSRTNPSKRLEGILAGRAPCVRPVGGEQNEILFRMRG